MKKILMLCVAITVASAINAQMQFGIQAGTAFSRSKFEFDGETLPGKSLLTGFRAGIVANTKIAAKTYFAPELNLVQKGTRFASPDPEVFYPATPGTYRYKIANLFAELNLNLHFGATTKEGLFAGFGPSVSYGLSGKIKDNLDDIKVEKTTTVKFDGKDNTTDNNAHLKALEIGGNAFFGYRGPSGIFIKGYVHISGTNLSVTGKDNDVFRTSYFGLGLGYSFGK